LLDLRFDDTQGTLLALGSSLVWASYWMVNLRDNRENTLKLFYNFLVGSILIMTHVLIFQSQILLKQDTLIPLCGSNVGRGFRDGLTLFYVESVTIHRKLSKITNLIFLTPFVSMFMIQSILKESIHPATIVGLLLIVGSNLLQKYYN
jgi:drug/metabolite transporter (DMT)-like permease